MSFLYQPIQNTTYDLDNNTYTVSSYSTYSAGPSSSYTYNSPAQPVYDEQGRILSINDTNYVYRDDGKLDYTQRSYQQFSSSSQSMTTMYDTTYYSYNSNGTLDHTERSMNGETVYYTYDDQGNVTHTVKSNGENVYYYYDANGNVDHVTKSGFNPYGGENGTFYYTYDEDGKQLYERGESQVQAGSAGTVTNVTSSYFLE